MIEFTVSCNCVRLTAGENANDTQHRSDVKLGTSLTMLVFPIAILARCPSAPYQILIFPEWLVHRQVATAVQKLVTKFHWPAGAIPT